MNFKTHVNSIPNFPKLGILYRDLNPLYKDPFLFKKIIDSFKTALVDIKIDAILAIESRGFIAGSALAYELGVSFIPMRKAGKMPGELYTVEYNLEYGTDRLEIQKEFSNGIRNVVIFDDILATGGTAQAASKLVMKSNINILAYCFIAELANLDGRNNLPLNKPIYSLIYYD